MEKGYNKKNWNEDVVRKGIGEVMGGKVLELETERLRAEGQVVGKEMEKQRARNV